MNKIKVTFYNDVSIVRNNDYKKASTASSAGFASGGIYFTSSNDITILLETVSLSFSSSIYQALTFTSV